MNGCNLRPLIAADAAAVAALIRSAFAAQSVVTDPLPSALRVSEADLAAHLAGGGGGAVAVADDATVGSALWSTVDGSLYLGRLAVAQAWRRRGVARALLAAAEFAARELRLPVLRLSTRLVLLDNRRLFAACGFVETTCDTHPGYHAPTSVNLEKRLAD